MTDRIKEYTDNDQFRDDQASTRIHTLKAILSGGVLSSSEQMVSHILSSLKPYVDKGFLTQVDVVLDGLAIDYDKFKALFDGFSAGVSISREQDYIKMIEEMSGIVDSTKTAYSRASEAMQSQLKQLDQFAAQINRSSSTIAELKAQLEKTTLEEAKKDLAPRENITVMTPSRISSMSSWIDRQSVRGSVAPEEDIPIKTLAGAGSYISVMGRVKLSASHVISVSFENGWKGLTDLQGRGAGAAIKILNKDPNALRRSFEIDPKWLERALSLDEAARKSLIKEKLGKVPNVEFVWKVMRGQLPSDSASSL